MRSIHFQGRIYRQRVLKYWPPELFSTLMSDCILKDSMAFFG